MDLSTPPHLNLCTPGQRQVLKKTLKYNDKRQLWEFQHIGLKMEWNNANND